MYSSEPIEHVRSTGYQPDSDRDAREHDQPMEERERRARELVECGDHFQALDNLRKADLFDSQLDRLKRRYGDRFGSEDFITDEYLEMAVVEELHDPGTWEHSLRVFELVRSLLDSKRHIGTYLREKIAEEETASEHPEEETEADSGNEARKTILLAALFHDTGKIHIPNEIINNVISHEEWQTLALTKLNPEKLSDARVKLEANPKLSAKDVVPMSIGLTESETRKAREFGIDPELPLGVVFSDHPDRSADILGRYGLHGAAEIARNHHDRPITDESKPISISAFRATWILRTADIFDAVKHSRSYKEGRPLLETLDAIDAVGKSGFIDPEFVGILIRDSFFTEKKNLSPRNQKEREIYSRLVREYLIAH